MHTTWSDGSHTIEEMVKEAKRLGRKYIAITDHAGELKVAGGMSEKEILLQIKEIEALNKKIKGIKILKGIEANIKVDGSIDVDEKILKRLDLVIASVHSKFKMSKKEMTKRICRAMQNPYVNIIGHPTGRVIQQRAGYDLDFEEILKEAKRTNTCLEINAYPDRLDLSDINIKKAVEAGVKLTIGTDSHHKNQLRFLELGIAQARRGWAKKSDILNCLPLKEFLKKIKKF